MTREIRQGDALDLARQMPDEGDCPLFNREANG